MQRKVSSFLTCCFMLGCLWMSAATAHGQDQPRAGQPLPHITIDPKTRTIDLDVRVVLRDGDWIELLGCAQGTREHESIFVIPAKPSHVHTALLLLKYKPGSCVRWHWEKEVPHMIPPHGDRVAVSIVTRKNGKDIETPANKWIMNKETKQSLRDNVWLFTGSSILELEDPGDPKRKVKRYRGDIEGNTISVVNFGDEVLGLPTQVTDKTDKGMLGVNTKAVPAVGTKLKLRLRPAKPVKPDATLVIRKDGTYRLNGKPVDAKGLTAGLKSALAKAKTDRLVKVEATADTPPTAYKPVLEALDATQAEFWHVVNAPKR